MDHRILAKGLGQMLTKKRTCHLVDFTVSGKHRKKIERKRNIWILLKSKKKDGVHKGELGRALNGVKKKLGILRKNRDHPNQSTVKIS